MGKQLVFMKKLKKTLHNDRYLGSTKIELRNVEVMTNCAAGITSKYL